MIRIALDAMGGDFAPEMPVKGALQAVKAFDDIEITLYGNEELVKPYLGESHPRIKLIHAPRVIDMGEHDPIGEIRRNRDTSLVMAFQDVRNKNVDGVVTAGPTQAVIVAAHMVIRRLPGMKRVALCPNIPTGNPTGAIILDVGANTTITPEFILQYAEYANIYTKEVKGIAIPKMYLLNIGVEEGKGRELEQATYQLLKQSPTLNFCGNIEPKEMLNSDADIIVTDGFSGNICVKTMEGTAKFMGDALKREIKSSLGGKIGYLFMRKNLKRFKDAFNTDKVGGAILFGVDGTVIKSHGSSSDEAIFYAISQCRKVIKGHVVDQMREMLEKNPIED